MASERELAVTDNDLELFYRDLWKDSRLLELEQKNGQLYIRRYSDLKTSIEEEYRFIRRFEKRVSFRIPEITEHTANSMTFEYIAGTRVFNLLVDLRSLYQQEQGHQFQALGAHILNLVSDDLREFQQLFRTDGKSTLQRTPYPAGEKLANVYSLLCSVLGLDYPANALQPIAREYEKHREVPFRDCSPKNIILDIPDLYQRRFDKRSNRLAEVEKLVKSGVLKQMINKETLYHIDFSGCSSFCPVEDDWIALWRHEASSWVETDERFKIDLSSPRQLCSSFVRYSRFAGRKLAYRLLNHSGYRVRFKYDDESFYFSFLKLTVRRLHSLGVPGLLDLIDMLEDLEDACGIVPETDYFHAWKRDLSGKVYYSDVFPN